LASRGYAVLSVNYRGSEGFGKKFINGGDREWAGKMHDDLLDAVKWATDQKIADPKKIAIMGFSYGGHATPVRLTLPPPVFPRGPDIAGPSNLATLLQATPPTGPASSRTGPAASATTAPRTGGSSSSSTRPSRAWTPSSVRCSSARAPTTRG